LGKKSIQRIVVSLNTKIKEKSGLLSIQEIIHSHFYEFIPVINRKQKTRYKKYKDKVDE